MARSLDSISRDAQKILGHRMRATNAVVHVIAQKYWSGWPEPKITAYVQRDFAGEGAGTNLDLDFVRWVIRQL
jgi:hypothetical protein